MNTKRLVRAAMVAAIYVVLCLVLAPFSYGAVQVRLAEMLCLLPVFGAEYIVAVTLGCFLANLLGSTLVDVVFGTAATLVACLVTYAVRKVRVGGLAIPAAVPPIVSNAVIVGALELTFFLPGATGTAALAAWNALTVGIGEVVSCGILGVALVKLIESNAGLRRLFVE
ncbi:QueT transporter family protein [Fournierella massiliensis]|uniref:QueT transporter family protein n=1 Tax=Allofournierella massiliensis TaxID=1650663 RepID=UPI00351F8419